MTYNKKYSSFVLLLLSCISLFGQLDSLKKQVLLATDSVAKADTYTEVSYFYYPAQYDSALYYCNKATLLFDQYGSARDKAYSHSYLGVLYKKFDLFDSSITHFHQSISFHKVDTFSQGVAANYVNLGNVYTLKKENDIALKYFFDALIIFENLNDTLNQAVTHASIGELLLDEGDFEGARKHFELSKSIDDLHTEQIGLIEYDLGLLELKDSNYNEAIDHFNQSVEQWKNISRNIEVAKAYSKIGESYYELNQFDSANLYTYKSLSLAKSIKNYSAQFDGLFLLAKINFKQENYSSTIDYLKEAIGIQKHIKNLNKKADAYYILYLSYKAVKNNSDAFKNLERYSLLKDSINTVNRLEEGFA